MFEAHFNSVEDFLSPETIAHSWTKIYYRRHQVSFRPLRIWFAKGKVKVIGGAVNRRTFAYIEYQDERGNNHYCSLSLSPELSVAEALREAVRVDGVAYAGA